MATITEIATGNEEFAILVDVLLYLDDTLDTTLVETLDAPDADLTVFAPTNAAFGQLAADLGFAGDTGDTGAVTAFLVANVDAETILDIVLYHVSPGTQLRGDIAGSDTIDTLNGAIITNDLPTLVDNEPDLIDPLLTTLDVVASNGVVHIIDKVLLSIDLPGNDASSITDIVASSGDGFDSNGSDFDILLAAVTTAGLAETLASDALDATVFAPTDAAFIGLANSLGFNGSDEEGAWNYLVEALALLNGGDAVSLLTDVLTYHVAGESLQASQVLASDEIETLQGGSIGVDGTMLVDAEPDLGDPSIVATDIQASNGIVHVIDGVLIPADLLPSSGAGDVDFIIGDDGDSMVRLGADNDLIDGNAGKDTIFGGADNDVIFGGKGRDELKGNKGNDIIDGGAGKDVVGGGAGADYVMGGDKDDTVNGGDGRDTIDGGSGDDLLRGGKAEDVFVFGMDSGVDQISDFKVGKDVLDISAYGFADFDELEDSISTSGLDVTIDLGDGNSIMLHNPTGGELMEDQFIF